MSINNNLLISCGGEGGIRTLDELLTHTHFPGVLLQPLGHLSVMIEGNQPPDPGIGARAVKVSGVVATIAKRIVASAR